MIIRHLVLTLTVIPAIFAYGPAIAQSPDTDTLHPLETHMKHWLVGSRQWRSPNPDYDPDAEPRTAGWIKEFGINWNWGPNKQHMTGEILAITAEGKVFISYIMYAFYNPVTEKVINVQVARNGAFEFGEDRARHVPTPFGDPEIGDMLEFHPNGDISILRHSNIFVDENTQLSDAFQRDESGEWKKQQQWRWTLIPTE